MTNAPEHQEARQTDRAGEEPGGHDLRRTIRRVATHAIVLGVLASLAVHFSGFLVAALVVFTRDVTKQTGGAETVVDFAVMTEAELVQLEQASLNTQEPTVPEVPLPEMEVVELFDAPAADSMAGLEENLLDVGPSGGGDIGDGIGSGAGGAGSGGANFFGVEATGHRFAYIVDISGSMNSEQKMPTTQNELIRSVDNLLDTSEFIVVLYSSGAMPLGGRSVWTDATERGKRRARREVMEIKPGGSTNPLPAFEMVLSLRPKPDAIYFMTDGEFAESIGDEIIIRNNAYMIPIHCITFVNDGSANLMRKIAHHSDGTYTHVPGPP